MALTLTVLGCDGSHAGPGPAGAASGYLLRSWTTGDCLWLDAGPGTFANLQRFCDPRRLTGIVLSHEHLDHWTDVEGLVTAARWTWRWDRDPVPVLAAPGIAARLAQPIDGILDWSEVGDGDTVALGGVRLTFSRTDHGPVTLAVRVEGAGRVLGYSADSGPGWSLAALGSDLDLALCEATFTKEYEGTVQHMSGRQAGRSARAAGARRLVLTHRSPAVEAGAVAAEAAEAFGAPVETATVGRGFSL